MTTRATALFAIFVFLRGFAVAASDTAVTSDATYDDFKRGMLPKVGQKITFAGALVPGKFGPYITPDHWVGVYVELTTTNAVDWGKFKELYRENGRNLKVEGVLHFTPGYAGPKIGGIQSAGEPPHFFFDVAEISFSETDAASTNFDDPFHGRYVSYGVATTNSIRVLITGRCIKRPGYYFVPKGANFGDAVKVAGVYQLYNISDNYPDILVKIGRKGQSKGRYRMLHFDGRQEAEKEILHDGDEIEMTTKEQPL